MIFEEQSYSPVWTGNFPLAPVTDSSAEVLLPEIYTHNILGGIQPAGESWRFEPGLGADVELSHLLLLSCGFKLTFANDQVYELLLAEPGLIMGRLPARANPELFSAHQQTEGDEEFACLNDGTRQVGLRIQRQGLEHYFVLGIHEGSTEECREKLSALLAGLPEKMEGLWKSQLNLRTQWCDRIPEVQNEKNPGLAFERLQSLLQPARGIFTGPWIRDPAQKAPGLSLRLSCSVIPAFAVFQPEQVPGLLKTLADLPSMEGGAWAETYTPDGIQAEAGPALPCVASMLNTLPQTPETDTVLSSIIGRCKQQVAYFQKGPVANTLPQWPHPETAFTPEVTDPEVLLQFDLAALLVTEIESIQKHGGESDYQESERKQFVSSIWSEFHSGKRKRLLDKTIEGEFASRVTAGSLIPLLWNRLSKAEFSSLRQALQNPEELKAPEGIRQWQPKKEDSVPAPVQLFTQHLFLPLLEKLSGEAAALLSADWHRSLENDSGFSQPETAALLVRLIPFANRVNPHLERYPAWVRSMEKHRKSIVTVAAVILFLIPASFGIYFTVRSDYNRSDELLQSGQATTLMTMGNLQEAEEVYTRLILNSRTDTQHDQYYFNRGNLRFKQGEFEKALEDYQQAIELDPIGNLYKARWNLGQTLARLDRNEEAIRTLQEFIDEYGEELPTYKTNAENAISLWQR